MPKRAQVQETGIAPAVGRDVIEGGSAGTHEVTGIEPHHLLRSVTQYVGGGTDVTDVDDLTDEFSISDTDEIDNTDGTDTTDDLLLVEWWRVPTEE